MNSETFLKYREQNVRQLALSSGLSPDELQQIAGWQIARQKLPTWAANDEILYPPHLSMEQCSSESTARYKAQVVRRLLGAQTDTADAQSGEPSARAEHHFVDLTGGFGVDSTLLAPLFVHATYIERDSALCAIAQHNFRVLGLRNVEVLNRETSTNELIPPGAVVYIDPARRDGHGKRTYAIGDCTPDVTTLVKQCRARLFMVKLSPMLDWRQAVSTLNAASDTLAVREVHIVAIGNECKELLLILTPREAGDERTGQTTSEMTVYCVNDQEIFSFVQGQNTSEQQGHKEPKAEAKSEAGANLTPGTKPEATLLLPNAAVMKGGCFSLLAQRYAIRPIAHNSHLFVAQAPLTQFPGRQYTIEGIYTLSKADTRDLITALPDRRCNIATRNFPLSPSELQRRLKTRDGGPYYLFGTTDHTNRHLLLLCTKQ